MAESTCPVCGSPIDDSYVACPKCGLKLADRTQSFTPVTPDGGVTPVPKACDTDLVLVVNKGTYAGQVFDLNGANVVIGRDPACDIFLNDMTVSRKHASITCIDGSYVVEDLGSLNGTWVDGTIVQKAPIALGATLQIGTFDMTLKKTSEV